METEEQQLEEIKKWWKEYGRTVALGVFLGLSGIGGWSLWKSHENTQAETASSLYQRLLDTSTGESSNAESAIAQTDALIDQYPKTNYAVLGALVGARGAYQNEDIATAKRFLEWASTHGEVLEVRSVASLRLARILTEEGQHDAALKQLDSITNANFSLLSNELRGDVLHAQGNIDDARNAYLEVLKSDEISQSIRSIIQTKLDDLSGNTGS
jgi:predicted negative regulator of RcsB-dependent stress response